LAFYGLEIQALALIKNEKIILTNGKNNYNVATFVGILLRRAILERSNISMLLVAFIGTSVGILDDRIILSADQLELAAFPQRPFFFFFFLAAKSRNARET